METSLHTISDRAASTLSTNGHFFVPCLPPAGLTMRTEWQTYCRPRGRLIGIFLYAEQSAPGPPYPLTEKQAEQLFESRFQLVRSELVTDSLPLFRGMERWQEWLKTI